MDKKDSQKKMCDCNQGRLLCSCKVPPAVAEYAVQELAALKAQPSGVDERAARVIGYRPGMSEVTLLVDGGSIPAWMNIGDTVHISEKARAQLAAPAGVVLPEPMKRGDEGGSGEYGAAMIRGYIACLREVARLNSPPVSAGDRMCTHPEGCTYCAWCGFKVSAGDDAEQAAFEAWLVRVCPSGDADSVRAQWLESSDYEDFCDQAYDAEAERLTAEALGVGAGINPNATSIDDIFLTESAGGVDERAAFDQIHACCSASAATSTFAGNRVPDPQARAATPAPAPAVEPAHSDVSVPRELLLRTLYNENPSDADFLAMRALLNGGQE